MSGWWAAVLFIVGSVGFVVGAVFGFPGTSSPQGHVVERIGFLTGGLLHLVGRCVMVPELAAE